MFTVSEICISADNHKGDYQRLYDLLNFVTANVWYYSRIDYDFMNEHIKGHINNIDNRIIKIDL